MKLLKAILELIISILEYGIVLFKDTIKLILRLKTWKQYKANLIAFNKGLKNE